VRDALVDFDRSTSKHGHTQFQSFWQHRSSRRAPSPTENTNKKELVSHKMYQKRTFRVCFGGESLDHN